LEEFLGSVFGARNRLDDRMYAIKKIVFNENTDRTRRQAKRALREVRVLASLSHPHIVQYHCAWLELVPIQARTPRASPSSSSQTKKPLSKVSQLDSLDEMIQFEGQSSLSIPKKKDEEKLEQKSSSTSQEDDDDGSELRESSLSESETNGKHSDLQIQHQYHSDGDTRSSSHYETVSPDKFPNKQIIPLHTRNEIIHPTIQSNSINSKIVLFIQMQLCDTTLHDWLRYRDHTIIEETSDEKKSIFYSLSDLGQRQSWHIFKQLLTAVQVRNISFIKSLRYLCFSIFIPNHLFIVISNRGIYFLPMIQKILRLFMLN
jgi:translation initiation factor 2-alpha kinase 1